MERINTQILTSVGEIKPAEAIGSGFCQHCQCHYVTYQTEAVFGADKGKMLIWNKGCECEDLKLGLETREAHKKMLERKMFEEFEKFSLIPDDLKEATFTNFEPKNDGQFEVLDALMDYVLNFDLKEPTNIILGGSNGVGKSHLGVATLSELMKSGFSTIFVSVPRLLTKLKSTFDNNSKYQIVQYLEMLATCDVLCLDDIGQEKGSEWVQEKMFEIIDSRSGKHTFFTTNQTSEQLKQRLGLATFSRINSNRMAFKVEGIDMRVAKQK